MMSDIEGPTFIQSPWRRFKRAAAATYGRSLAFMQSHIVSGGLFFVAAMALILVHGLFKNSFTVDQTTLGLLAIAAIPMLSHLVTSFKAGNVEVAFRDLSVPDQLFKFLDGIATKRQWTFFTPRSGEEHLGPAFTVLTEQLLARSKAQFIRQLRVWLSSDDVNHRWFAAEIVGFHKVAELRGAVGRAPETADLDEDWETWELNCVWAKARLDEVPYKSLKEFLKNTKSRNNQRWVLVAFDQMIEAKLAGQDEFEDALRQFTRRLDAENVPRDEREALFGKLAHINDSSHSVGGS